MGDPVSSALIGAVVGELVKDFREAASLAINFPSEHKSLKSTIELIQQITDEIVNSNQSLDLPIGVFGKFNDELKKGNALIRKCSRVRTWNCLCRYWRGRSIRKWNSSIRALIEVDLQLEMARDGKKVLVKLEVMDQKLDLMKSSGSSFCSPVFPPIPDPMVGWEMPLRALKMQLLKDDVSLLVLTAAGGCGKTTLASKLCQHDKDVKGKYDERIFWVNISNTPNLRLSIQILFRQMVGEKPDFLNDEDAVTQFEFLLSKRCKKPALVVLDDVWPDSSSLLVRSLSKLSRLQVPELKILVTARYSLPQFHAAYKLNVLRTEDAIKLFRGLAFRDGVKHDIDDILLNKIIKGCNGFPLALEVTANLLNGQPRPVWTSLEEKLQKGLYILDSDKSLLYSLTASLDILDESVNGAYAHVKECFLDLGSFLEDQRIPSSVLRDVWSELYNLTEADMLANLHKLNFWNLANLVVGTGSKDIKDVDECNNELLVTQHDMLRELAIHQSSLQSIEQRKKLMVSIRGDDLPKFLKEQLHQSFSAQLLSISTDENFSSWNRSAEVNFPEVEVLILNFLTRDYTLPEFMLKMNKLKSLIIINHGIYPAELSNFATIGTSSKNSNIKRIRLEKISITSLNEHTIPVKNLRKISLVFCKIGQVFRNSNIEISKIFTKIEEIEIDYCNDLEVLPIGFCDMIHLKKLCITNCHQISTLPEDIGKLENLEVLRLHSCTKLSGLPKSIGRLHRLRFLDISDCLDIKELPEDIGELCGLSKLDMRGCSKLRELPKSIVNLTSLKDVICDEDMVRRWEPFKLCLPILELKAPQRNINLNWLGL